MSITSIALLGLLCGLLFTQLKPVLLFVATVAGLYLFGIVDQTIILNNAINRSVITLILLLVASLALEKTVLLAWLASRLFHQNYFITVLRLGGVSALCSAFLNNTAVVATLMGSILKNADHPPSRLLIPLSYFAILGGTMTLIGTATHLVVNGLLEAQGLAGLAFLDFLPVGICLLIGCGVVIVAMTGLLPNIPKVSHNTETYFIDAEVNPNSKLIGKTVRQNRLRALEGLFLAEIVRGSQLISPVSPETLIEQGDKLIFTGDVAQVKQLNQIDGLAVFAQSSALLASNLTQVIISPESVLVNRNLKEVGFRSLFDAAVVAISRRGQRLSGKLGEQTLCSGDKLILAVGEDFYKRKNLARNFFLLDNKQTKEPLSFWQNMLALLGFFVSIIASVVTSLSLIDTLAGYIVVMVVIEVLDSATIRRRFPFELWLMLVCALTVAFAFSDSGLASYLTKQFFTAFGTSFASTFDHNLTNAQASAWSHDAVVIAYIGLFVITLLMTEAMTNSAAAAIMLPVALALASTYQVNVWPMVMAVTYAASASFISPFGYQTNLMVMSAGGYRIQDFIKVGWPITLTYSVIALIAIPVFFPFYS